MRRMAGFGGVLTTMMACRPDSGLVVVKVQPDDTGTTAATTTLVDSGASPSTENTPPEVAVELEPTPAFTDDILQASVEAVDADGDPLTTAYGWSINGASVATTTDRLEGTAFGRGDQVEVTVEVSDGIHFTASSASVTIENSPPTAAGVDIQPSAPLAVEALVCSVSSGATDLDGDPIAYTAAWTVDGVAHTGTTATTAFSGDTVSAGDTTEGEVWTCFVTPSDGTDTGPVAEASVTIGDDGAVSILVLELCSRDRNISTKRFSAIPICLVT